MNNNDLNIIVPVFNKWAFTKSCLNDLSKLNNNNSIIIIDNGSTDETQSQLENSTEITYHRLDMNCGFSYAVNRGYKLSTTSNVLFINNDIRVQKKYENWTDLLISSMTDFNLVGPTGGFVDPYQNYEFVYETNDPNKKINYMSGWCLGAKRNVWDRLILEGEEGPFNSQRYFCFFEDTDVSFRAAQLGIKFQIVPIDVVHFGHVTAKTLNINKMYLDSKQQFFNKWKNNK